MKTVKAWLLPLGRTFLAGVIAAAIASLTALTNVPAVWVPLVGVGVTLLNALLIMVQHVTPGLPTPVPPAVAPPSGP